MGSCRNESSKWLKWTGMEVAENLFWMENFGL